MSSSGLQVTRKMLSERTGVPLDSLTAIERGIYRLNRETAQRIAFATGVSVGSLIMDQNPLRASDGSVFTNATRPHTGESSEDSIKDAVFLLRAAIESSRKAGPRERRDLSQSFLVMFKEWLGRAMADLDAERPFWNQLLESWTEFEPDESIFHQFNPNAITLGRTGKQRIDQKFDEYAKLWSGRRAKVWKERIDILCEQLSGTESKTLRRYLEKRDTSGLQPRTPKQQERWVNLDRKAHANFAKTLRLPSNSNDDWFAVDQELTKTAYQRLANQNRAKRPS
jgi:transcriptional regulator with XRE-family HTH domain